MVSSVPPKKIRGLHVCMGLQGGGVHFSHTEFSHTTPPQEHKSCVVEYNRALHVP